MISNTPIRVLCVFSVLDRGGAESMCMNLYRHIDRNKIQFDFIKHSPEKGDFEDEILSLGGRIFEAPRYKIYNHLSYTSWWRAFLKDHPEYKIIHGHYFTISAVYFKVAKEFGLFTVGHSHTANDVSTNRSLKWKIVRLYELEVRKYSDYCLACSKRAGEYLFPGRKFHVLPNAIDTSEFSFSVEKRNLIRSALGIKNELVIGHVGNIAPVKNHTFLIDVFKLIHDKRPESKLLLVGNGDQTALREKVRSLCLDNDVIFTGARSDVPDLLQAMDVFAFPSLYEGLPVTVVEAQAAGLKCILSKNVTREVDITETCTFLPIDNPNEWADVILNADLTRVDTSELIKEAGYDIHTTAKWLENFYLKIQRK